MKKFGLLFAGIFLMSSFTAYAAERATPEFDNRHWNLGWSQNTGDSIFEEYTLEGETVENWSELVTIQFFPGLQKQTNPDIFEASQKRNFSLVCPGINWKSIEQTETERMWEWSIQECAGQPDQSEIARMVRTEEGFHLWHYAIKKAPLPADKRGLWVNKLKAIKVIKR